MNDIDKKAKELVEKLIPFMPYANSVGWAKECAIITVEEIIKESTYIANPELEDRLWKVPILQERIKFWHEVKEKIKTFSST